MRRKGLVVAAVSVLAAVAVLVTQLGCAGKGAEVPSAEVAAGSITISAGERIESADPHDHNSYITYIIYRLVYDPLVERAPDGSIKGVLAESWTTVDPKTWEFKLRQDVSFHNGEKFDANAVKATIERFLVPGRQTKQTFMWKEIEGVDVVDPYTVRIRTKVPLGGLLANLTMLAILPPSIKDLGAKSIDDPTKGWGTGPYRVVAYVPGESITLEADAKYWGGAPRIKKVTYRAILESSTRVAGLKSGDLDVVYEVPVDQADVIAGDPKLGIVRQPSYQTMWFGLNNKSGPFSDMRVRKAATLAVDRNTILTTVLKGRAQEQRGVIAPGVFGAATDLPPKPYDPEKAKALLRDSGIAPGTKLRFITIGSTPLAGCEAIAGYLNAVGFDTKVEVLEAPAYVDARESAKYDIFGSGFSSMTGDAEFNLPVMISTITGRRLTHYDNPRVNDLLRAASAEVDQEKRAQLYREAQAIAWEENSDLWYYNVVSIYGYNKRIEGFATAPSGMVRVWEWKLGSQK